MKGIVAIIMVSIILILPGTLPAQPPLFDRQRVDAGTFEEGRTYTFPVGLTNISGDVLSILKVISSCGCTEVGFSPEPVPPGSVLTLQVTTDTTGKKGSVVKVLEIYTSASDEPFELVLNSEVTHPEGVPLDAGVIFRGSCAGCHVGKDVASKQGRELYDAICYMCHKEPDTFAPAGHERLAAAIANGVPGTSMPGYSGSAGGPLEARQVESLAEYIRQGGAAATQRR